MVSVTKIVTVCDRCAFGREQLADEERKFSVDGSYYELKLCGTHAAMFDRDIGVWTLLATEVEPPVKAPKSLFAIAEERAKTEKIRQLAQEARQMNTSADFAARRAAEIEGQLATRSDVPLSGAHEWNITHHAHERAEERGFSEREMLLTATQPEHTYPREQRDAADAGLWTYQRGGCRIGVNPHTKTIVTVMPRETPQPVTTHLERKAQ